MAFARGCVGFRGFTFAGAGFARGGVDFLFPGATFAGARFAREAISLSPPDDDYAGTLGEVVGSGKGHQPQSDLAIAMSTSIGFRTRTRSVAAMPMR